MIEIKSCSDYHKMAVELAKLFDEFDLYEHAVVGSFHPFALYSVRKIKPDIVTLLLVQNSVFTSTWDPTLIVEQLGEMLLNWSNSTWLPSFLGVGVIGFDRKMLFEQSPRNKLDVESWYKRGYYLNCWTVNNEVEKKQLRDMKVAVTTDYLFPVSH